MGKSKYSKNYWKHEAKVLRKKNIECFGKEFELRLENELLKKAGDFGARMAKGEHEYMMTGKLPETGNEELARLKEEFEAVSENSRQRLEKLNDCAAMNRKLGLDNGKLKQSIDEMVKFSNEQDKEIKELGQAYAELERLNKAGAAHVERQANEIVMLQKETEQNANGILAAMKEANSIISQLEKESEGRYNILTEQSLIIPKLEKEIIKLENRELELLAEIKDLKDEKIPTLDAYNEKENDRPFLMKYITIFAFLFCYIAGSAQGGVPDTSLSYKKYLHLYQMTPVKFLKDSVDTAYSYIFTGYPKDSVRIYQQSIEKGKPVDRFVIEAKDTLTAVKALLRYIFKDYPNVPIN